MKRLISILSGIILIASSLSSCPVNQEIKEKTFTVTRKNEDGTILEIDSDVKEGELPSFDGSTPSKENDDYYSCYFLGWDKKLEPIYSDITYIAIYDKTELTFTVTWENYDGTILEVDENVKRGTMPEYNGETPLRESDENYKYIFKGWSKVLNPVEENITFKAIFDNAPSIYTVKFLNYDGTLLKEYNDVKFNEFAMFYQKKLPQKERDENYRYNFIGWSPSLDRIKSDTTYIAQFERVDKYESEKLGRIPTKEKGQIFIYGEYHGDQGILEEELNIWGNYYTNYGFRHLFIEYGLNRVSQLNAYIKSPTDEILKKMYYGRSSNGDPSGAVSIHVYNFYKTIKYKYPETIIHGVDVANGFNSNPEDQAKYLINVGYAEEWQYDLLVESLTQEKIYRYYSDKDDPYHDEYRELMMARNFVKELSLINGENVMGIFGGAHIGKEGSNFYLEHVPSMGNQLYRIYGENLYSEDLVPFQNYDETMPDKDFIENELGIKDFSSADLSKYNYIYKGERKISYKDYVVRRFYLVEDAYEDLKDYPKTGEVLPYNNFPFEVELNQVYAIDYVTADNRIDRKYYRSDPNAYYDGRPTTVCIGEIKSYQSGK